MEFVSNIMLQCPHGMENAICGQMIGSKGRKIWALQEEFNDPQLKLQCQLMDELENVTFITYSTTNSFAVDKLTDRVWENLERAIYNASHDFPDQLVEASVNTGKKRITKQYVNGVCLHHEEQTAMAMPAFADEDFPAL
jgi:hypothetical protein